MNHPTAAEVSSFWSDYMPENNSKRTLKYELLDALQERVDRLQNYVSDQQLTEHFAQVTQYYLEDCLVTRVELLERGL